MNILYIIISSFIFIILILNSISFYYKQEYYIIKNRSELNNFYKYSQLQTKIHIDNGELQNDSYSRYYCEYWCNPEYKNGRYIFDENKMKIYNGKTLEYGKDIHGNDFPIIIPYGVLNKKKIHFDFNNFKEFIPNLITLIKK